MSEGERESHPVTVLAAMAANLVIMVAKFVAFGITGSGAMLSEAIHTLADVLNQILLMVGIVRSEKPADGDYRYGYGQERFVWALISAVGIFFLGCGVTLYHGISSLMHPHEVSGLGWAVGVLLFSLDKPEAFPVDVWIDRALREQHFSTPTTPMPRSHMRPWAQERFGRHAGYANQYLFHSRRLG